MYTTVCRPIRCLGGLGTRSRQNGVTSNVLRAAPLPSPTSGSRSKLWTVHERFAQGPAPGDVAHLVPAKPTQSQPGTASCITQLHEQATACGLTASAQASPDTLLHVGYIGPDPATGLVGIRDIAPGMQLSPDCKIHVLLDLDNLHPDYALPEFLLQALEGVLGQLGTVASVQAWGNMHTFSWPATTYSITTALAEQLKRDEFKNRRKNSNKPYKCGSCGNRFPTAHELDQHFKNLHERKMKPFFGLGKRPKGVSHRNNFFKHHANKVSQYLSARDTARGVLAEKQVSKLLKAADIEVHRVGKEAQATDTGIIAAAHAIMAQHRAQPLPSAEATSGQTAVAIVSDDRDFTDVMEQLQEAGIVTVAVVSQRSLGPQRYYHKVMANEFHKRKRALQETMSSTLPSGRKEVVALLKDGAKGLRALVGSTVGAVQQEALKGIPVARPSWGSCADVTVDYRTVQALACRLMAGKGMFEDPPDEIAACDEPVGCEGDSDEDEEIDYEDLDGWFKRRNARRLARQMQRAEQVLSETG